MPDPFGILLFHMKISVAAAAKCGHGMTIAEGVYICLGCRKAQILIVIAGVIVRLPVVILYAANAVGIAVTMP